MKSYKLILLFFIVLLLANGCVGTAAKEQETQVRWPELVQEDAYTLADGTAVDIYTHGDMWMFRLKDGSVLLTENAAPHTFGQDIFAYATGDVAFQESHIFSQVSEDVRTAIYEYFQQQGKWYDLEDELENAYALYQARIDKGMTYWKGESDADGVVVYRAPGVSQTTMAQSCNDRMICLVTEKSKPLPLSQQPVMTDKGYMADTYYESAKTYTVFSTQTGERIEQYDMFTIPAEEIGPQLVALADDFDDTKRNGMIERLKPEYIGFEEQGIVVYFPSGVIAENEVCELTIQYAKAVDILQPWAIPDRT